MTDTHHHRLTLLLRREPEGHGILFLDRGDPRHSLEAIAMLSAHELGESHLERALREDHLPGTLGDIASALKATKAKVGLPFNEAVNQRAEERVQGLREKRAGDRAQAILQFVRWLFDKYNVVDGGDEVDDEGDLINSYFARTEMECPEPELCKLEIWSGETTHVCEIDPEALRGGDFVIDLARDCLVSDAAPEEPDGKSD